MNSVTENILVIANKNKHRLMPSIPTSNNSRRPHLSIMNMVKPCMTVSTNAIAMAAYTAHVLLSNPSDMNISAE